jgi:hypothetical protein
VLLSSAELFDPGNAVGSPLVETSGLRALQLSNPMFAGTLFAIVLLVLGATLLLAARWRRRRV